MFIKTEPTWHIHKNRCGAVLKVMEIVTSHFDLEKCTCGHLKTIVQVPKIVKGNVS